MARSRAWMLRAMLLIGLLGAGLFLHAGETAASADSPAGLILAQDGEGGERGGARVSLFEAFFLQRHPATRRVEWLGSLIIWFLLALSAVSLGLIGRLAVEHKRARILPDGLRRRTASLLREKRYEEAVEDVARDESYFARVLTAALAEAEHGHSAMVRACEQSSEQHTVHLMRRIEPLNVIGNVAPMIGLFGTVYGMILAFREIVAAGGAPDPVNLAAGIGTALVTTFWGLIVAIPALAAYAFLRNTIDGLTVEASRAAEEIINQFRAPGEDAEAARRVAAAAPAGARA